ncbi:FG-GAP repeat protein [bacterium]|nr:FG-GAP repeat protein [bacterium]MBU1937685.1 FG-GAP repeat protein [bacterium]
MLKHRLIYVIAILSVLTASFAETESHLFSVFTGKASHAYFGSAVLGAADWRGSGEALIAAAASGGIGLIHRGAVYLYDTLDADAPVVVLKGMADGDLFGYRLAGMTDINGDSIPDLAVSAPYMGTQSNKPGKVYLYLGGSGFGESKPLEFSVDEKNNGFGRAICVKDLNGDGLADLIVGAPYSNQGGILAGRVYIWWGSKAFKSSAKPDVTLTHGTTNDMFGSSLAVGDLNSDGHADLVVGSPQHNIGEELPGSVYIFFGGDNAKWTKPSLIINGETTTFQDHFGATVAIAGDVNGDGSNDLLIGAPNVKIAGGDQGRVYLFSGGQSLDDKPDLILDGEEELGLFGSRIFGIGDLNQDGKADFAIHAESAGGGRGVVYFFYGGWERPFYEMTGEYVGDRLGNCVVNLGDYNKDGTQDVAVCAAWNDTDGDDAGRIYILSFSK